MKKYQFRLESYLRIKKFGEEIVKQELGLLYKELSELELDILNLDKKISEGYKSLDEVTQGGIQGEMLQFYPRFISGLKEDLTNKDNLKFALEKKIESKKKELASARGDVKVIENMKTKDKNSYKKKVLKKEQEEIEEMLQIRRANKESFL